MKNKHSFKSKRIRITFCSVDIAEEIVPNDSMCLISIGNNEPNNISYEEWKHSIRLRFDDITRVEESTDKIFTTIHAKMIIDFVSNLPKDIKYVYVHCWAGVSRSAAVAKFLMNAFFVECRDEEFEKDYLWYNELVYETLMKVWKESNIHIELHNSNKSH